MKPHMIQISESEEQAPKASLLWRAEAVKIIKEHRPGTLDGEIEALLNICLDMYSMGLEDARDYFKALVAKDNVDPGFYKAIHLGEETSESRARSTPNPLDQFLGTKSSSR